MNIKANQIVYAVFDIIRGDKGERDINLVGVFESESKAIQVKGDRFSGRFYIPVEMNKVYDLYEKEL